MGGHATMYEKKYQIQLARNVTTDDVNATQYSDMLTREKVDNIQHRKNSIKLKIFAN